MFAICQHFSLWFRGVIYKNGDFDLEDVWLWRISGGYSQEMMGLVYDTNLSVILHVFTACQLASKIAAFCKFMIVSQCTHDALGN